MREIKFRAWDKDNKMMHEVAGLDWCVAGLKWYGCGVGEGVCEVIPKYNWKINSVLMQFTGLKDKNGKAIYEGDIVEYIIAEYHPPETGAIPDIISEGQGEVYFNRGAFEIRDAEYTPDIYELEIIGNIWENLGDNND